MLDSERIEFDRHLSVLAAGFNVPLGDRGDAYWRACRRWQLSEFIRAVDAALQDGDKMPTVAALRGLREKGRSAGVNSMRVERSRAEVLAEAAVHRFRLSDWQLAFGWSFIFRDADGPGCECLGIIIARDPSDPGRYPEHRMLWSDCQQWGTPP